MSSFFLCGGNPFFDAYAASDLLGKAIFITLIATSIVSWSILLYKLWLTKQVKNNSLQFKKSFFESRNEPLSISVSSPQNSEYPNAFGIIYDVLKNKTLEIFNKSNKEDTRSKTKKELNNQLCTADIALLETHAASTITALTTFLEKNLYILSTIVTLAPFLGLLGTVYGILTTFTELKTAAGGSTNQMILAGLSLALSTTVLGLINAIPALIGYNYLKNVVYNFDAEMDRFATDVLSTLEIRYRKPVE